MTEEQRCHSFFLACKASCVRYVSGSVGIQLKDTVAGLSGVSDGFETATAIAEATVGYSITVGSQSSSDLDGYVDDTVAIDLDIFEEEPTLEELTVLYETFLRIKSATVHTPNSVRTLAPVAPTAAQAGLTAGRYCEHCGVIEAQQEIPAMQPEQTLPAGYTQLAYLDSTGGAYIDTGVAGTKQDRFVLWGLSFRQKLHHLMGAGTEQTSSDSIHIAYTDCYRMRFFRKVSDYLQFPADSPVCVIMDLMNNACYINGSNVWLGGYEEEPAAFSVYLFAKNVSGKADLYSDTRIYRYQHFRNDHLIRDMIPCVQDATGTYGMYDLVEGKFYTNAGSGSFSGSAELEEHTYYACTVRATCSSEGYTTYTCIGCGDSYTSDVTACSHSLKTLPEQMPTWQEEGYTQHQFCILCGKVLVQQEEIPAIYDGSPLPEEYIRLDYLDSSGNAYIDTGVSPSKQDTFILYGYSLVNTQHRLMGTGSDVSGEDKLYVGWNEGNNGYYLRFGECFSGHIKVKKEAMHCFIMDYPSYSAYLDAEKVGQASNYYDTSPYSIYLFGYNSGGSLLSAGKIGNARIYGYKHYRDGVLLRNMVPVFHTETGEYGMYDFVESKFYTNEGDGKLHYELTGKHSLTQTAVSKTCTRNGYTLYTCSDCGKSYADSFIQAGHTSVVTPATLPTLDRDGVTEERYCTVCNTVYVPRQTIPAPWSGEGLPLDYTYVEYVESVGDAYIDTGVCPAEGDRIWLYALADYNDDHALMGSGSYPGSRDSVRVLYTKGSGYSLQLQGGKSAAEYYPARDMLTFGLDLSEGLAFVNGKTVYNGEASVLTNPYSIYLFSCNCGGEYDASQTGNTRIYGYRHYRGGELVRYMVPCRSDSDGEYGLYDLVEGKFYANAGSGYLTHDPVDIVAGSAIVMELETGNICYEKNSSAVLSMDHSAKLMTAILALENLELQGRTEKVRGDDLLDGYTLGLRYGESLKVIDAIYGLVLTSGNDAAMLLAKTTAGSYDAFVTMMNEKALELGMLHTCYANPTGLTVSDASQKQYTTVADTVTLIRYALENETFRKMLSTGAYEIAADKEGARAHSLVSSNPLLLSYEGSLGGMNGSTGSHIQLASRHGTTVLAVLMNSDSTHAAQDAVNLLDYGFSEAPEHSYTAVVIPPECTQDGYTVYSCPCGESYTADATEATGHSPEVIRGVAPSCTEKGMTDGLRCGLCGELLQPRTVVSALGHSWTDEQILKEPVGTQWGEAQYTCSVCGLVKLQALPPEEHVHSYEANTAEPSCTEAGFTEYTCLCGDSYTEPGQDPLGHSPVTDPGIDPGCFTEGLTEGSHCGLCGEVLTARTPLAPTGHRYTLQVIEPTCTELGCSVYTCQCGDSYRDDYTASVGHDYSGGVCVSCGKSLLGYDWRAPELAQGDYTVVVIPDTQYLVEYSPDAYGRLTDWIANNASQLNVQAVLHLGDMVNSSLDTQWELAKQGMDKLNGTSVAWMPMRGNHDDSAMFNYYFDYTAYGTSRSWFGGSYQEGKLDHTYWYFTVGERQYMVLSLGWAPGWEVLDWAEELVKDHPAHNVILTCHAYMNYNGKLLQNGDIGCVNNSETDSPEGADIWNRLKGYDNIVLALGGHIPSNNLSVFTDTNGAGREVANILADAQNMDLQSPVGMVLLLTFHEESDAVDLNWYSVEYDALHRKANQFSVTVPHLHTHEFTSETVEPTCAEQGCILHSCSCGDSYRTDFLPALGHTPVTDPGVEASCLSPGLTEGPIVECAARYWSLRRKFPRPDIRRPWIRRLKPPASGQD